MTEHQKPEHSKPSLIENIKKHPFFTEIIILVIILIGITAILVYNNLSSRIAIDKAEIYAPIISLAPTVQGVLEKIYVSEGDSVGKHKVVALISGKPLSTVTGGTIISIKNTPGQIVSSSTPIISMIDPKELRLIGHIDEDKGLADIHIGQRVTFEADAFGSKTYEGIVEEIGLSARQQDIVFSISDKREIRQFDIKVKFDVDKYPELKNGMSAKMKVYKYTS